ncbi:GNAT family N-acetyltransferase [Roseomonas sp. AR75]|uniref:GNAT family N-acetyltransferase n=1 Tax=Roseomonas sp. AR75 TaxID=2562311 RepID=UPI0010C0E409|nr:GNAT family N-acetyltransferase [Roseomonas sp. AR75]
MTPLIRPARPNELEPLLEMQQRSLRVLAAPFYGTEVLEAALAEMGTMDPRMIGDGTYLVAELDGRLAGSAGWSLRKPNFARLLKEPLLPLPGRCGMVRSVFVAPELARRGIARRLMAAVEQRLAAAGVDMAELMATLSGAPLYRALGYCLVSDHALALGGRMAFPVCRMIRPLAACRPVMPHPAAAAAPYPAAAAAG